jgi:phosphoribosylformylglycinamidine synthase
MALAGDIGAAIDDELPLVWNAKVTAFLFGEQQGRFVCTVASEEVAKQIRTLVEGQGLQFAILGRTGDHHSRSLEFGGYRPGDSGYIAGISLAELRAAHDGFFPKLMGSELTPEF